MTELHLTDTIIESPIAFYSHHCELAGILCVPQNPRYALVFSPGWSGTRNGPGDLLVHLARSLAEYGVVSLRFDFRGRGESQGNGMETTLATMAEDLQQAMQWMKERFPQLPLYILGLCSGGNVAIGALPRMPQLSGLLLLSVYPFSDGDSFIQETHRFWYLIKKYIAKACRPANWARLISGDASLARILKVLVAPFHRHRQNLQHELGNTTHASQCESRKQDAPPPTKYLQYLKDRQLKCLMIYGTADPEATAAFNYFNSFAQKENVPITFHQIQDANHNFSSLKWHQTLIDIVVQCEGFQRAAGDTRKSAIYGWIV